MPNMVPVTWRRSIGQLRDNITDAFERWLPRRSDADKGPLEGGTWPTSLFTQAGPALDVTEDDDTIQVTAELPGLSEKDFTVELSGDRLVLRGEKKASREEKKRNYHFAECSYGSFTRSVPLPCEVDRGKASAKYKQGVLAITLPKTETAKAKRVKINVR